MKKIKEKVEVMLSSEKYVLETGMFELTAESQRLLILLLISNIRKMGQEEKVIANATLATFLSGAENHIAIGNDSVH